MQDSTRRITSDLGDLSHAIQTKLDVNEQTASSRQRTLDSKLDTHHDELTTLHESHTHSLIAIGQAQASAASSQGRLEHASAQISRRTTRLSQDVKSHRRASDRQHQKTREFILATVRDLRVTQHHPACVEASQGTQVVYAGEDRELIVPALYFLKKDFASIFDQLVTDHCHDVLPSHASWLQSQLHILVASAAQENAQYYARPTATSSDSWTYVGAIETTTPSSAQTANTAFSRRGQKEPLALRRKTRKSSLQLLRFKTSRGELQIRLPRRETAANTLDAEDEISLSYCLFAGEPFVALHARFTRLSNRALSPSICAQLQIFLPFDESQDQYYEELLERSTIQEFDRALRDGSVSPYRQESDGLALNPLLGVSVCPLSMNVTRCIANLIDCGQLWTCGCTSLSKRSRRWVLPSSVSLLPLIQGIQI